MYLRYVFCTGNITTEIPLCNNCVYVSLNVSKHDGGWVLGLGFITHKIMNNIWVYRSSPGNVGNIFLQFVLPRVFSFGKLSVDVVHRIFS